MDMRIPDVSVIVPSYQRRELVRACVRSLAAQQGDVALEVVVVVDGSTDGTAQALRALDAAVPLTVLEQPNGGCAAARNSGVRAARGRLLLFLDDDMEAHPRMVAEHLAAHDGSDMVVIGHIPVHPDSPATFLSRGLGVWADERLRRLTATAGPIPVGDLITGQMSVPRALFDRVGGYDERYTRDGGYGNEDLDLSVALAGSGARVVFRPQAVSYQRYAVPPAVYLRQWGQAGEADVAFTRKHPARTAEVFATRGIDQAVWRWLWRAVRAVPGLGTALAAVARPAMLAVAARRPDLPLERPFKVVRNLEYWRGVRRAGGIPSATGRAVRVLAYHAIADVHDPRRGRYAVPPERFAAQLRLLARAGARFISGEEFLRAAAGRGGLPRRAVLVTFDDCYEDLYTAALPILHRHGVPAVAFAIPGLLGDTNRWDQADGAPVMRMLDAGRLASLPAQGVEIGAHTVTHPVLTRAGDDAVLAAEVAGSVTGLMDAGLPRPRMFAYPYGEHDARVRAAVADAGVECAFAIEAGRAVPGRDRFTIPRIEVLRDDTGWRFLAKVVMAGRLPRARRAFVRAYGLVERLTGR